MMPSPEVWDAVAALACYPDDESYAERVAQCVARAEAAHSPAAAPLTVFHERVVRSTLALLQERYTAAFDLDAACAPEIGWHLFSDGPDRGPWLAMLRAELARAGITETGELPDHLAHLLRLVARENDQRAAQLAAHIAPVVEQIRDRLAARDHEFTTLLEAAACLLRTRRDGAGGTS